MSQSNSWQLLHKNKLHISDLHMWKCVESSGTKSHLTNRNYFMTEEWIIANNDKLNASIFLWREVYDTSQQSCFLSIANIKSSDNKCLTSTKMLTGWLMSRLWITSSNLPFTICDKWKKIKFRAPLLCHNFHSDFLMWVLQPASLFSVQATLWLVRVDDVNRSDDGKSWLFGCVQLR